MPLRPCEQVETLRVKKQTVPPPQRTADKALLENFHFILFLYCITVSCLGLLLLRQAVSIAQDQRGAKDRRSELPDAFWGPHFMPIVTTCARAEYACTLFSRCQNRMLESGRNLVVSSVSSEQRGMPRRYGGYIWTLTFLTDGATQPLH